MSKTFIGIAEMKVSDDPEEVLIASNLGSCLGMTVYDHHRKIGAMIHCLLPLSKSDPLKAQLNPNMYVDTGVVAMLNELFKLGCNPKELEIVVAGCASINDTAGFFEIGKKNITILRKILWKNNLLIKSQDVGEDFSRTLSLNVGDGTVTLRANGSEKQLN